MIGFCNCKDCKRFKKSSNNNPDVCEDCDYENSLNL